MTKVFAKIGGRETLKDGIISKLQRHIASQRKLLIVIAVHDKRFLDPSVLSPDIYVCFRTPIFKCLEPYVTTWPPYINF